MCFFLWCSNGDRHGDVSQRNLKATNERESVDMWDFRREEEISERRDMVEQYRTSC